MSIEVKQMVVKSNVVQRYAELEESKSNELQKKEILGECKRLILEALHETKER